LYLPVPPIHSIGPLSGSSKSFDPFPVFTMLMRSAEEFAPAGPMSTTVSERQTAQAASSAEPLFGSGSPASAGAAKARGIMP